MVIDFHTHVFPEKIAVKAAQNIGKFYDGIAPHFDGSVSQLLSACDEAGVDRALICSVATTPAQVSGANRFIALTVEAHPDRFIGFGSLHPDMDDPDAGVNEIIKGGLMGVKLHPDMQQFALDDPRAVRLAKAAEGRLPMLVHTGDKRFQFSNPLRLKTMLREAPDLVIVAAHLGGWSEWEDAETLAGYKNLYVDCSSSLPYMTESEFVRRIRLFGADRVLFGTDYPMWTPKVELERFMNLPLHEDEREQILHKTAETLLGL